MSFFSKSFSKGTIIESEQCIHIKTGKIIGSHKGVVHEKKGNWTIFSIFSTSKKQNNNPLDMSKFSNDFGKNLKSDTKISEPVFMNKTKLLKKVQGGGKYE